MMKNHRERSARRATLFAALFFFSTAPGIAASDGGGIGGSLAGPSALPPPIPGGEAPCLIADPTGTPLRYRTAPNGRILGSFDNGARVTIIDHSRDGAGKQWVYVADAERRPIGWIYRDYITCR